MFSEGYSSYYKAVFYNDGGELEINGGYYEIFSPYEQGDCSVVRTTSGYTYIHDGTFDSSAAFGGDFYGKYITIDVMPFDNYLKYGCLFPGMYVLGGNFYITNGGKDGEEASFAYCNNGWGRRTYLFAVRGIGGTHFCLAVSRTALARQRAPRYAVSEPI